MFAGLHIHEIMTQDFILNRFMFYYMFDGMSLFLLEFEKC